jgi:plastocyanin
MKKMYTTLLLVFAIITFTNAATVVITVTSNQFSPANPTVVVGDIVRFSFQSGFHNASSLTVSNAVPAGAAAINSGSPSGTNPRTYDYTVTVAGSYKYICDVHADGPSFTGMVATFTATPALPVVFKDFLITANAEKKPAINWSTLTEQNVSHFVIRRSYDGFKFEEIATVNAAGNSTIEKNYSLIDNSVSAKNKYVYYAITVVDKDGKITYSPTKSYKNPIAVAKLIMSVSPNPISRRGQLMIQFNAEKDGELQVKIYNSNGRLVATNKMSAYTGLNNGHVHVCELSAGTYSLQFTLDGVKETKRVVVH